MTPARRYLPALATLLFAFLVLSFLPPVALATCTAPKNAIEAENCLPGTPPPLVSGTFRRQAHRIFRVLRLTPA